MDDDPEHWKVFHNRTREYVVFLLLFIFLYIASYCLIATFKKRLVFYSGSYEDAVVYRISLWMSTFSLAVSLGAALLLPISIISNEILLLYPNSYYVQWINISLIHGLWNLVFLFSNVSLFILLPFSHLLIESEGFPGSSKGIMARVYEAVLVLTLLGLLIMGITCIIAAIFDYGHYSMESFLNVSDYYLPFLYSCVSFLGVLMLLSCTPVGFARLFSVMADLLIKPKYNELDQFMSDSEDIFKELRKTVIFKESLMQTSAIRRNIGYPIVMTLVLSLTTAAVFMVTINTLELCFGIKTLPIYSKNFSLGINSLSALGPFGAAIEIILILYLWCTSIVGLYSLPFFSRLQPKLHGTTMTQVIGNCAVLLVLSSALPVLARSLGITNFDLLGDFGRIKWLGNFYIVLFHNIVFAFAAAICLGTKITAAVRQELYLRWYSFAWAPLFRAYEQTLTNDFLKMTYQNCDTTAKVK